MAAWLRFAIVAGNFDACCNFDCGSSRRLNLACVMQWVQSDISHSSRPRGTAAFHGLRVGPMSGAAPDPVGRNHFCIRRGRACAGHLVCFCAPPCPACGDGGAPGQAWRRRP